MESEIEIGQMETRSFQILMERDGSAKSCEWLAVREVERILGFCQLGSGGLHDLEMSRILLVPFLHRLMPLFRGGVLELVHHFRLLLHDGVAGGEEFTELRGGVVRDAGSGWHMELGRAGLRTHLDGQVLLGSQFIGVLLLPLFHSLVLLLSGCMSQSPHKLLVVPHEFCATDLEGDSCFGGRGRKVRAEILRC